MAESRREPVPRTDTGELDTALAFLSFARQCVLKKLTGLTDAEARQTFVQSGTSLLGLVQHLTEAERFWFTHQLAGETMDDAAELGMTVPAHRAAGDVVIAYRAAIRASDRAIRAAGDPDALSEQIDGTTGR